MIDLRADPKLESISRVKTENTTGNRNLGDRYELEHNVLAARPSPINLFTLFNVGKKINEVKSYICVY